jgi:DNA-directed RNA polymerase specialized sigma24 family protein
MRLVMSLTPIAARFPTTCWTRIALAVDPVAPETRDALAGLCAAYWFPVYAFIRRKGHGPENASDLTQEFFARLLETGAISDLDRGRGRFRSFLLAACTHFLSNARDHDRAQKRGGDRLLIPIDSKDAESRFGLDPAHEETAERIFEQRWALALLGQVHEALSRKYHEEGNDGLFDALWVTLSGESGREPYAAIGGRLGMTEGAVQMAAHRLRRRYGKTLRALIADTVSDPALIDDEIRDLFAALKT